MCASKPMRNWGGIWISTTFNPFRRDFSRGGSGRDSGDGDSGGGTDRRWTALYRAQQVERQCDEYRPRVVVIGAGNTAIDCATIAKRLGAEQVTMVYRRTATEMTAYPHEVDFVRKEGVEFRFLAQPARVLAENGRVAGLNCLHMELGAADSSGRRVPRPVNGVEFTIPTDQIVKAVGQEKPALGVRLGLALNKGYIHVNSDFETSLPGVFAGGDCIRAQNAASTVMAVQDGKLAAAAIHARISDRRIVGRKEA